MAQAASRGQSRRHALNVVLAGAFVLAAFACFQEIQVVRAVTEAGRAREGLGAPPRCGTDTDVAPRAAVANAIALSFHFAAQSAGDRACLADRARRYAAAAEAGRPGWAKAAVLRPYVDAVSGATPTPVVLNEIAASYHRARFLREDGSWRVRFVVGNWSGAGPALRARVLDEAAWLSTVSRAMSVHVELIMLAAADYSIYDAYRRRRDRLLAAATA